MMDANRFFGPDMETVQWLEQEGYNVSYTEDLQVDQNAASLLHHKIFLISGHSEYWSMAEYNNIMAARNAGVSVVSLSGNTGYWNTRYTDNYRTLVCYKTVQGPDTPNDPASLNSSGQVGPGDNPSLATTTRRDAGAIAGTAGAPAGGRIGPNTPENQLLGSLYIGDNDSEYWGLTIPASDGFGNYAGNDLWRNSGVIHDDRDDDLQRHRRLGMGHDPERQQSVVRLRGIRRAGRRAVDRVDRHLQDGRGHA